jgi:hypothetical protein
VLSGPVLFRSNGSRYGEMSSVSVPFDRHGYLGPLQQKLKRSQFIPDVPHIIAIDVSELPDAFHTYKERAFELLSLHPRVSAVLLFQHVFCLPMSRWDIAMYANPNAANPLHESLRAKMIGDGTLLNCKFDFSKKAG